MPTATSSAAHSKQKSRLLIVTADSDAAAELIRALGSRGYPVVGTASLVEGEEVARRYTYDVLVVSLPAEVAVAFLGRIRRCRPQVRAVLVDMVPSPRPAGERPEGFWGRVGRPYIGDDLVSAVEGAAGADASLAMVAESDLLIGLPTEGAPRPPLVFKPWPNRVL